MGMCEATCHGRPRRRPPTPLRAAVRWQGGNARGTFRGHARPVAALHRGKKESRSTAMLWLLAGAILGWLANIEMAADRRRSLALNVAAGIVGALLAGSLVTLPLEPQTLGSNDVSPGPLLVASLGAIIPLSIVHPFKAEGAPWKP